MLEVCESPIPRELAAEATDLDDWAFFEVLDALITDTAPPLWLPAATWAEVSAAAATAHGRGESVAAALEDTELPCATAARAISLLCGLSTIAPARAA
jgi:hypothetical protein